MSTEHAFYCAVLWLSGEMLFQHACSALIRVQSCCARLTGIVNPPICFADVLPAIRHLAHADLTKGFIVCDLLSGYNTAITHEVQQ